MGCLPSSVFAMETLDLLRAQPGTSKISFSIISIQLCWVLKFSNPELRQVMRKSVSVAHRGDLVSLFLR